MPDGYSDGADELQPAVLAYSPNDEISMIQRSSGASSGYIQQRELRVSSTLLYLGLKATGCLLPVRIFKGGRPFLNKKRSLSEQTTER